MKQYICPICGNPGVGDYCHNKIVCPTCGSDLSVFQTIHKRKNTNKLIILLSILCIAASVFFAAYFVDKNVNLRNENELAEKDEEINKLQSEINVLNKKNTEIIKVEPTQTVKEGLFFYTVRKGDSFCVISQRFYGTEIYYKEIAEDNSYDIETPLVIGQQLIIKNR